MSKEQKIVVVTGSASGIGLGLCNRLISEGSYLTYGIDKQNHPGVIKSEDYEHIVTDLRDFSQTLSRITESGVLKERVFALVNAAGVMPSMLVPAMDPDVATDAFKVNCVAPVYLSKLMLKALARSKGSSIINITSIAADIDIPGETIYCASKSALTHVTQSMAKELARFKIKVNSIAPALIATNMTAHLSEAQKAYMLQKQVLNKEITVDDVVEIIINVMNTSDLVTGSTFYVGGVVK
ncbi:SDR family NAD(P)-dependent oxidoreductase [Thiohalocapsa marina]|nr:SDR family oxidoreductase [Thiohalocapsa marina]